MWMAVLRHRNLTIEHAIIEILILNLGILQENIKLSNMYG